MSVMANKHLVQIIVTVQALRLPRIFVVEKIRDKIKEDHLLALISGAPGPYSKLVGKRKASCRDCMYGSSNTSSKARKLEQTIKIEDEVKVQEFLQLFACLDESRGIPDTSDLESRLPHDGYIDSGFSRYRNCSARNWPLLRLEECMRDSEKLKRRAFGIDGMDGMVSCEPYAGFGKEVEFIQLGATLFEREDIHPGPI